MHHRFEALDAVIRAITYKPGWRFRLILPRNSADPMLSITCPAIDVDSAVTLDLAPSGILLRGRQLMLERHEYIDFQYCLSMSAEELIRRVYFLVTDLEKHEQDEWFKFNGEIVYQPHKKEQA